MHVRAWFSVLLLVVAGPVLAEETDLAGLKGAYDRAADPEERLDVVNRIARLGSAGAAGALDRIARLDQDPGVRVAAVRGLALLPHRDVTDRLLALLLEGGVRTVRETVAEGLAGRDDGAAGVTKLIANEDADDLARGLGIAALGHFRDPMSLHRLMTLAASDSPFLRAEALRALARRPDGTEQLALLLEDVLIRRTDPDTVLTALLVIRAHPDERLRAAVKSQLKASPLHRETAMHVLKALDHAAAMKEHEAQLALKRKAEADGYGLKVPDPPEPPEKPGWKSGDLVFVIDATGSTSAYIPFVLDSIGREFERITCGGGDLRVGVVTYRGARWQTRSEEILPLTHDLSRAREFLRSIRARGADSQGSAASYGLWHGLGRMGWRAGAESTVNVVTDCKTHDPQRCRRLASLFHRADAVVIHVEYFSGGRKRAPGDLRALAEAGGGRYAER